MLPNVFTLLKASAAVKALVGSSPLRAYRHGNAPENVAKPYITWSATAAPENQLDGVPFTDRHNVQVDAWADDDATVETLAIAIRDAIEPTQHMTGFGPSARDPETMRYRFTLTFTFWLDRS